MNKKILLLISFVLTLMLMSCQTEKQENPTMDLYKNKELETLTMQSYDKVMKFWTTDYDELWIETDFGLSHLIVSGPQDAPPLFLFAGLFGDATMWYPNVGKLAEEYRVYCPDQMTYGGKSQPDGKKIEDINGYVCWYRQLLDHLDYSQAAIGGLSYGAWMSLAIAREVPDSVAAVIMMDPSVTFIKMNGGIAWRGMRDFAFFPNRDKHRRFFDWMGGGYSDEKCDIWMEHMLDVIEYGTVGMFDIPQHRIYQPEELTSITMPVMVMAGGKPIVYKDPQVLAAAAKKALPHAEVKIIADAGHGLNVEKAEEVNENLLQFLRNNYDVQVTKQ